MTFRNNFLIDRKEGQPEVEAKQSGKPLGTRGDKRSRVLLFEPHRVECEHIRTILESLGFSVLTAHELETAIAASRSWHPHVVLAATTGPDYAGYKLCQRLKHERDTEVIPVMLVLETGRLPHQLVGHQSLAEDYIQRPVAPAELKARIDLLLSSFGRCRPESYTKVSDFSAKLDYYSSYSEPPLNGDDGEIRGLREAKVNSSATTGANPARLSGQQSKLLGRVRALLREAESLLSALEHEALGSIDSLPSAMEAGVMTATEEPSSWAGEGIESPARPPVAPSTAEQVLEVFRTSPSREASPDDHSEESASQPWRNSLLLRRKGPWLDLPSGELGKAAVGGDTPSASGETPPASGETPKERDEVDSELEKLFQQFRTWESASKRRDEADSELERVFQQFRTWESASRLRRPSSCAEGAPPAEPAAPAVSLSQQKPGAEATRGTRSGTAVSSSQIVSLLEDLSRGRAAPKEDESVATFSDAREFVAQAIADVATETGPEWGNGWTIVRRLIKETDRLLVTALDRDQEYSISAHSVNVAVLAIAISKVLRRDEGFQLQVGLAALLHEVGVADLPPGLMFKADKLGKEEIVKMRLRPLCSAKRIRIGSQGAGVSEIVAQVFERVNGNGHPLGLKGSEIREESRVLGLADAFEACVHQRPYRAPMTGYQTISALSSDATRPFPENLLKALIQVVTLYPLHEYVVLSNGEVGKVVGTNPNNLSRPRVLISDTMGTGPRSPRQTGRVIDLASQPGLYIERAVTATDLPARPM